MDITEKQSDVNLIKWSQLDFHQYDFEYLITLLKCRDPAQGVKFIPATTILFPASDILKISCDGPLLLVQLNFMGLYGVDSPLPHYFLQLAGDDTVGIVLRDFLDIFSHRLYQLFYLVCKKYNALAQSDCREKYYPGYLNAFSGNTFPVSGVKDYRYAKLFGKRQHCVSDLYVILSDYLPDVTVHIQQWIPHWLPLTTVGVLGGQGDASTCLGDNTVVGNQVIDLFSQLRIELGPFLIDATFDLLPHQPGAKRLRKLINAYLGAFFTAKIVLLVTFPQHQSLVIGGSTIILGWCSWLGRISGAHAHKLELIS